jgi:hypothetical protein
MARSPSLLSASTTASTAPASSAPPSHSAWSANEFYGRITFRDCQGVTIDECMRDFAVCALKNTPDCRTRNTHALGGFRLVQAFIVNQPDGFHLVEVYRRHFQRRGRHPGWLEQLDPGLKRNTSCSRWSTHTFLHSSVMSICS